MKKEKISLGQKIFSCTVYLLSIFLTFFPWIAVGGKRYHIFEVAVALKRTGLKELAVDDSLFASNMAALKAGIWAECGLFFCSAFLLCCIWRRCSGIKGACGMCSRCLRPWRSVCGIRAATLFRLSIPGIP